ncbi:Xaa-Pro peptidase family protein [Mesorhizobium sp. M1005]|uniref:M24 family metallopeptidase n=1 Tax=unclassified Mesorhizobium TaxID=325217 RepID=UPI0033385DDD
MLSLINHGFKKSEFEGRVARAQTIMVQCKLDGLLLSAMDNVRYFLGVDSNFWESYTRPWLVLIPARGDPIAIIPEISRSLIEQTWLTDIRSWPSPRPEDEGTSLAIAAIDELPRRFGRVGAELGLELRLGMPPSQLHAISTSLLGTEITDASNLIWQLRMIKSSAEVDRIRQSIAIANFAFTHVPEFVNVGDSEREIHRKFRISLTEAGADAIPMLLCRAEQGGINEVTGGPRNRRIKNGDLLFIDTGTVFDGYFCDYDRNFQVGNASDALRLAYENVWEANAIGIDAAKPGATAGSVFAAMNRHLSSSQGDTNNNGRMGHGLGLRVSEPPSLRLGDNTRLQPGMVICVEPALEYEPGKMVLHEEIVLITEDAATILTPRTPKELPRLRL